MDMVKQDISNRIGYLTLNRPDKRNALSFDMVFALKEALVNWRDLQEVKVIVLMAAGKVFCAGADLASLQQLQSNSFEENKEDSRHLRTSS